MKCALIIPAWQPEELFSKKTAASQLNYWQPLGTLYVAASLKKAGHEVRFYNGAFFQHAAILRELSEFQPGFVGIYSTTFGWDKAQRTAKDLKATLNDVFTCVGGPYPIAMQKKCLQDNASIDAVVTGEGEVTVPEIVAHLEGKQSLLDVLGVAFRQGDDIICNEPRPLIEDLDNIPFPARELLSNAEEYLPPPATYRRKPVAVMLTARGCNRRCIFCSQIDKKRKSGIRGIRFRSVDDVMAEIEHCLAQGYREIKFIDDTLAADYDRAMEITREIKRRKLDFTWFASACVNQVDKPLLKAMKEAGCWAVLFGAESGVQKNLNTLRKGTKVEQIRRAVADAKAVGLKVTTPFIIGIPGETYEEALQTIEFAMELNPDIANFHALTAFPGTHLHDNLEQYGRVSDDLTKYTYQGASFVPYTMTQQQIHGLRQLAFKRFYSRPKFLINRALQIRSWNDCVAAYKGVKSLFWIWRDKNIFSEDENNAVTAQQ
jgi:anaerobic magnesium-protoporphyrin IX monomethyl ester cyclase